MHWTSAAALLLSSLASTEVPTPPVEVQAALQSLRPGERARLERALGATEDLPLYRAELVVDPARRTATARVSITLTPTRPLEVVHLRLTPLATHPGAVTVTNLQVDDVRRPVRLTEPSLLEVPCPSRLEAGRRATLVLRLEARLPALPEDEALPGAGLEGGGGDHGAFGAGHDVVSLAGLVPMLVPVKPSGALAEGPSGLGDLGSYEPSHFVVTVSVPSGWRALAPGLLAGEFPERTGRQRFTYTVAAARELPVLVTRGYVSQTRQVGDVTVESWATARDATSSRRVLDFATGALELLEARLGPYPYKVLRVVETPLHGGAGGMEFPGLVTIARTLYRGAQSPLAGLGLGEADTETLGAVPEPAGTKLERLFDSTLEFTVQHELAHQYFAGLVGNDPVLEPVVDEALAQHVALLVMEWRHGKPAADMMRDGQLRASYQLYRLTGGRDAAADRPTWAFDSNLEYAALVYGKAPFLFDAWRARLGAQPWLQVLRAYVAEHRYTWATSATLEALAARHHPEDAAHLAALRRRFWDEAHGDEDLGGDLANLSDVTDALATDLDPGELEAHEAAPKQLGGE